MMTNDEDVVRSLIQPAKIALEGEVPETGACVQDSGR